RPLKQDCQFLIRLPLTARLLLKVEQRLRLNHRYLVRVSREGMDVQFSLSCLEVNIAERLQTPDF
ncbi:unnamed protein product, partial [marine sediment metagenome]